MNILLGISSSIAIYKSCELIRKFIKEGHNVQVIMTKNAKKLISPKLFSALTGRDTFFDLFSEKEIKIDHIELAKWASCFLVAPATANIIGKFSSGIADDFLTTYYLAHRGKTLIAPAMNNFMWESKAVKDNIEKLKERGNIIIEPETGPLACGEEGKGRMASIEDIYEATISEIYQPKIFKGKKVIVTAGPTREYIDPVRFITNPSSGKMGYSLAKIAKRMGAEVLLLCGNKNLQKIYGIKTIYFETSDELLANLKENIDKADFLFMAAAVGDFKTKKREKKIRRSESLKIEFTPSEDIIKNIRKDFKGFILGFAAEDEKLEENGRKKMEEKLIDAIFVNDISRKDIGFESNENEGIFISKNYSKTIKKAEKDKVAEEILLEVSKIAKLA